MTHSDEERQVTEDPPIDILGNLIAYSLLIPLYHHLQKEYFSNIHGLMYLQPRPWQAQALV